MKIKYYKYQALQNDFLVVEAGESRVPQAKLSELAEAICRRRLGVGADGVLYLSASRKGDCKIQVINSDGGHAEKSGNGLRIAGLHSYLSNRNRNIEFETAVSLEQVKVVRKANDGYLLSTSLGVPNFLTKAIPVKSRSKFMINAPLKIGDLMFPVTCLSVGNPHTVLFVDDFNFDWQSLGAEIEFHKAFPHQTNVEFVKVVNKRKIKVAEWERGAGATGSSGTGAAAAVCASVMLGLVERKCEAVFEFGSLSIQLQKETDNIELTGEVGFVCKGTFDFK